MNTIVAPGSALGVLGSGQLGRMFAIAARRMGYRVHVLSPDDDTPAGQVADVEVQSSYDDLDAVTRFARSVDVVTFEFENIPLAAAEAAARHVPVRPHGCVLHTTQNRFREKTFLRDAGLPIASFATVRSLSDLDKALATVGLPAVMKTADWGYDGKGQCLVGSRDAAVQAWQAIEPREVVLEPLVRFVQEVSVVAARGVRGELVCYEPVCNVHRNHVLDLSVAPAGISSRTAAAAVEITRTVLTKLEVVGVLCVEFFITADGDLLINELAPRPHNSGHLTVDAHVTCQFEQQVRAVCGLSLGSTAQLRPAAMVNLLGDLWTSGSPVWDNALNHPNIKLHLYGKCQPRPGRKMGHLTVLADTSEDAAQLALRARQRLGALGL